MAALSRATWVQAGLDTLDRSGYANLSAEKIARRLNVTRGSFYHHFRHRADFVRALLERWEADYTDAVLAHAAQGRSTPERLERYLAAAAQLQPGREVAIRAWAGRDIAVRAVLARVDAKRYRFAQESVRQLHPAGAGAAIDRLARMACLAFIGFQQTGPHQPGHFAQLMEDLLALARHAPLQT
jgi:AcrR family transcriptional regulator